MCPPWEEEGRIRSYVAAARPPFLCKEERIPRVSISPTVHPKVHPFRTNLAIFSLSFPSSFHSLIARNQRWKIFDPKRARAQGGKIVGCGRRKLLSLSSASFFRVHRTERAEQREREREREKRERRGRRREREQGGSREGARERVAVSSVTCRRRLPFRHRPSPAATTLPQRPPFNNNNNRAGLAAVGRRGGTRGRGSGRVGEGAKRWDETGRTDGRVCTGHKTAVSRPPRPFSSTGPPRAVNFTQGCSGPP